MILNAIYCRLEFSFQEEKQKYESSQLEIRGIAFLKIKFQYILGNGKIYYFGGDSILSSLDVFFALSQ